MKNSSTNSFSAAVDFRKTAGTFNTALHSSNASPNLSDRGMKDFTPDFKRMNFEYARNHDWALWNAGQRMVDTHFIFPLMHLDPSDPENYYFDATDEIIRITQEAGCKIFYRLGTSIEHTGSGKDQHFNSNPPENYETYAEVLAGIIRHYTKGWANGFHYNIQYWEIWNEAEYPQCWNGSYEEFIKFFIVVLKRLKAEFPEIKVGGPAATELRKDLIGPLLDACKAAGTAPDFISWHNYGSQPDDLISQPGTMKDYLEEKGFPDCELCITEWHYILNWDIQKDIGEEEYRNAIEGRTGLHGIDSAAYNLAVLCGWQNTCLNTGCYYGGGTKSDWGFLTYYGGHNKNFYSMCIFGDFLKTVTAKVETERFHSSVYLLGGLSDDSSTGMLLVVDYRGTSESLKVQVTGMDGYTVSAGVLDHTPNREEIPVLFESGVLKLQKNGSGSAAFLVKFEKK